MIETDNSPAAQYKDRKIGLVIFGAATALMGFFCALLVPLMFFGASMAARSQNPPPNPPNLWLASGVYLALAVTLIWLGAGSIMAKRWARALLVIGSWSWLVIGLITMGALILIMPQIIRTMEAAQPPAQPPLPESARTMVLVVMFVIEGFLFVALPLLWALFYSGKNVRATCETRDPVVRWTDRCPLPVLAVVLYTAFAAPMLLVMPWFYRVALVFGTIVSGPAAATFYLIMAFVWGYCAWALYRLDRRGWWVYVIAMIAICSSTMITYARHGLNDIYSAIGYSPDQLAQIQPVMAPLGAMMNWITLGLMLPFLGYLIYIRKYFPEEPRRSAASSS